MKNQLIDLHNHLFAQIERVGEEGLEGDELKAEVNRSKAMTGLAKQVIDNASLALHAEKFRREVLHPGESLPPMLDGPASA